MEVERAAAQVDVQSIGRLLWRRKAWIIGAFALVVGFALFQSLRSPKIYQAQATARYADPSEASIFDVAPNLAQNAEQSALVEIELAKSRPVFVEVADKLGDRAALLRGLDVAPLPGGRLLLFKARSTVPAVARDAATAYAAAYALARQQTIRAFYSNKANELRRFAEDTNAKITDIDERMVRVDTEIAELEIVVAEKRETAGERARLATLRTQRQQALTQRDALSRNLESYRTRADQLDVEGPIQSASGADALSRANLPVSPISPTPMRDATVAGVLGLMLGVALAFGRDHLDDRVHTVEDVEGALPRAAGLGETLVLQKGKPIPALSDPRSPEAESFRSIRANLQFASLGEAQVVLVTSSMAGEGKTATVANLAASLASSGASVIAVEGDLRRPSLSALLGGSKGPGLIEVLLGQSSIDDALVDVTGAGFGRLRLLPSGLLPPNPVELLGSAVVGELIAELRTRADIVLIDTPPVLPVNDAVSVARWADGAVFVVRIDRSRRREVRRAVTRFTKSACPLLGYVVAGTGASAVYRRRYYGSRYYGTERGTSPSPPLPRAAPAHDDVPPEAPAPPAAEDGRVDPPARPVEAPVAADDDPGWPRQPAQEPAFDPPGLLGDILPAGDAEAPSEAPSEERPPHVPRYQ
jgi:non-specific protein-tyrosine kinase